MPSTNDQTLSEHEAMVRRISEAYAKRGFVVQFRRNNLPSGARRDEAIYRPDLLVRGKADGQILFVFYKSSTNLRLAEKRLNKLLERNRIGYLTKIEAVTMKVALAIIDETFV